MPDLVNAGTLATNQEYRVMIPGFWPNGVPTAAIVDRESLIIRAVEAAARRETGLAAVETEIEDEEYTIRWPDVADDIVVRRQTSFALKRAPISEFTSLKMVLTRSAVDGTPETTEDIPRNVYTVELDTGIVRELDSYFIRLNQVYPLWGLPPGVAVLLASYTAADSEGGDLLPQLKLLCFMATARIFQQFTKNHFDASSSSYDGQSVSYLDVHWTKQEQGILSGMKRGFFARSSV